MSARLSLGWRRQPRLTTQFGAPSSSCRHCSSDLPWNTLTAQAQAQADDIAEADHVAEAHHRGGWCHHPLLPLQGLQRLQPLQITFSLCWIVPTKPAESHVSAKLKKNNIPHPHAPHARVQFHYEGCHAALRRGRRKWRTAQRQALAGLVEASRRFICDSAVGS